MTAMEFHGKIGDDWRDSEPWWPPVPTPPDGAPNVVLDRARRRRLRPARLLRLRHRHAGDRRPGRRRRPADATSTPPRCARPPGPACSRAGTITAAAWAGWPTWPSGFPGTGAGRRARTASSRRSCARTGTPRTPSASGTSAPRTRPTWPRRARRGRSAEASTAGTGSTAARRTSSCPPSTTTTTPSDRREPSRTATTSAPTWPTGPSSTWATCAPSTTEQPFFLYFCTGACHSPHHAPAEWIERYRGRFAQGWDRWRDETFARQLELGRRPRGHGAVAPARPGSRLGHPRRREQRTLAERFMECFAAFLSYTDAADRTAARLRRRPR